MKTLLLDIEGSGLIEKDGTLPENIWCICCEDLSTGEKRDFIEGECYTDFPEYAKGYDRFVAHNAIGYDIPVLKGLTDFDCSLDQVIDTLVLSKLFNPDRGTGRHFDKYKGPAKHSLAAWGIRFDFPKGDYNDWSAFSPEMLTYCRQDVSVLRKLYFYLLSEKKRYGIKNIAIRNEHRVREEIRKQQWNGFYINRKKLDDLYTTVSSLLKDLERQILPCFPLLPKPIRVITPKYKKNGDLSVVNLKAFTEEELPCIGVAPRYRDEAGELDGSFTLVKWVAFDLASPKQIVDRMNRSGWNPTEKTKGHIQFLRDTSRNKKLSPEEEVRKNRFEEFGWKVSEENLATLPESAPYGARLVKQFVMLASRKNLMDTQWYPALHPDTGRIHGNCDSLGAGTHRMTHSAPNMANIPAMKVREDEDGNEHPIKGLEGEFRFECRDLWSVDNLSDYVLFGTDASGLEARMLAHFMGDPSYIKTIVEGKKEDGTDVHTVNQHAAGLRSRAQAKTFFYGFLYGAGAAKIGNIVNGSYKEGTRLIEKFLDSLPGLKRLQDRIKEEVKKYGYITGLDGRIIHVRSDHAALNTLLQGNGAIVCKLWLLNIMDSVRSRGLDVRLVNSIHDEYQFQVHKKDVEAMKVIVKQAMKDTERELKVICPLDCDYSIGDSWASTH